MQARLRRACRRARASSTACRDQGPLRPPCRAASLRVRAVLAVRNALRMLCRRRSLWRPAPTWARRAGQVAFVPGTHYVFTAGKDRLVKFWDADRWELLLTLEGHHAEARRMRAGRVGSLCRAHTDPDRQRSKDRGGLACSFQTHTYHRVDGVFRSAGAVYTVWQCRPCMMTCQGHMAEVAALAAPVALLTQQHSFVFRLAFLQALAPQVEACVPDGGGSGKGARRAPAAAGVVRGGERGGRPCRQRRRGPLAARLAAHRRALLRGGGARAPSGVHVRGGCGGAASC